MDVDHVAGHAVRAAEQIMAKFRVIPAAQCRPAAVPARYTDIVDEQVHQRIEIPHVERDGILGGELPNLVERLEAVDPGR